jgi:hypothetical protein
MSNLTPFQFALFLVIVVVSAAITINEHWETNKEE